MQIQVWQNSTVLDGNDNSPNQAVLQNASETVTFTLVMTIQGSQLHFSAKNVSSPSFGDLNHLSTNVSYTPNSFANYQTSDTVAKSGILLGANRVASLTLKQVRKINQSGTTQTEPAQIIYPAPTGGTGAIIN